MEEADLKLYVDELGKHLQAELSLLHAFCKIDISERTKRVKIVAMSACTTGNAIHILSKNPDFFYPETVMLSRSFIEKIVNFCYLQVCDEDEFERFFLHPLYRAFHNSDKSKHAGKHKMGLTYSGRDDMKNDSQMQKALSVFSESDPRMNWSKFNVDQKIALISERSTISVEFFLMNTLTIYSNASEALHGSLYGCSLPTGAYIPGVDSKDLKIVKENILKNLALLYVQMSSLIHELLKMFADNKEVKILLAGSNKNHKLGVSIMKLIFV